MLKSMFAGAAGERYASAASTSQNTKSSRSTVSPTWQAIGALKSDRRGRTCGTRRSRRTGPHQARDPRAARRRTGQQTTDRAGEVDADEDRLKPTAMNWRANALVSCPHSGKMACLPTRASRSSRYARMSARNRSPNAIVCASASGATKPRPASVLRRYLAAVGRRPAKRRKRNGAPRRIGDTRFVAD